MRKLLYVLVLAPFSVMATTCPDGFVAYEYAPFVPAVGGVCPFGYVVHDVETICGAGDGVCWLLRTLCGAGIDKIKTSTGIVVPLYADKHTTPSVHIRYNNTVCYADLEPGNVAGAINIKFNGDVYHTLK